jgi:transcriptional regulator with XRE-family HTH domain
MADSGDQAVGERLAANVRALRDHQGISQAALARAMKERGHSWYQATVHRVESGVQPVSIEEATGLAAILGVPLDRLTWATGEAAEQIIAEGAIVRLREAAEEAANSLARLYAAQSAAEHAARNAGKSKYQRVRDTVRAVEAELEDATVQNVLAESGRRWDDAREGRA